MSLFSKFYLFKQKVFQSYLKPDCPKFKLNRILETIISFFFILMVIAIFISKTLFQFQLLPNALACITIALSIVLVLLLLKYSDVLLNKINRIIDIIRNISFFKLLVTIVLLSLITRILFIFILNITCINDKSDINLYVTTSYELSHYGKAITHGDSVNRASYLFWYAMFLTPVSKFFGLSQTAFSIYIAIIVTISYALLFDTVAFVFSKTKAFLAFIFLVLSPSQILLSQYIIHEHALLFFLSIALWIYFRILPIIKNKTLKIIIHIIFFIMIAFCRTVDIGGLLLIPAFVLLFIIYAIRNNSLKEWGLCVIKCASLILAIIIVGSSLKVVQVNRCKITKESNNSLTWTLYLGANYETSGEYNKKDAHAWFDDERAQNPNTEESYHNFLLIERYKDLFSNPIKPIKHLINKFNIIWQRFNYSIGRAEVEIPNLIIREFYSNYLYKIFVYGDYFIFYLSSIIMVWSVFKFRKNRKSMFYVFVELYLMGFTAMLFLSELSPRYTVTMYPFYFIAAFMLIDKTTNIKTIKKEVDK